MILDAPMNNGFARTLVRNPRELDIYREQTAAFRRKFGREMGPEDPFFFDPDADTPQFRRPEQAAYAIDAIAVLMGQAGLDPAAVYAFKKTRGLFPTADTCYSIDELTEWNQAINEYEAKLAATSEQ
jgi:hypothetical protein